MRKLGAIGMAGLQRFFKSRVATFTRRLATGKEYVVDAMDLLTLNVVDLLKSPNRYSSQLNKEGRINDGVYD